MRVAGADEAGRGPLAGPVVAAAVVLDREQRRDLLARGLGDSKTLTPRRREDLFQRMEDLGVPWRAQAASAARIDGTHILAASLWALGRALEALDPKPDPGGGGRQHPHPRAGPAAALCGWGGTARSPP